MPSSGNVVGRFNMARNKTVEKRVAISFAFCASVSVICTIALAKDKPTPPHAPVAWGQLGDHKACIIFREYQKTKVRFYVVAATKKTQGELEVVEVTDGY